MQFHSFLLADVGNTRIKLATAPIPGRGLTPKGSRVPLEIGDELSTSDFTAKEARRLRKKYDGHFLVFSTVVPQVAEVLLLVFKRGVHQLNATYSPLGFQFAYPKPQELGADRIAAAVVAHAEKLFPAVIIACGTATAFSVLDRKGHFCGGAIAPGLHAQLSALAGATAQLPLIELRPPRQALAKSTTEAMRTGLLVGFLGGTKEILRQLTKDMPGWKKPRTILTGGDATLVAENLGLRSLLRPLLVLEGLHIIGQRLVGVAL